MGPGGVNLTSNATNNMGKLRDRKASSAIVKSKARFNIELHPVFIGFTVT
jgi:hypothetical protein